MKVSVEIVPGGVDVLVDGDEYAMLWSECDPPELLMARDDIQEYLDEMYPDDDNFEE